jgi:hypothetical protein
MTEENEKRLLALRRKNEASTQNVLASILGLHDKLDEVLGLIREIAAVVNQTKLQNDLIRRQQHRHN